MSAYSSFEMNIAELACSFDNLIPLAHELSNPDSRIAKKLKRITVHILPEWDFANSSCAIFNECDALLSSNSVLEYVLLGLPDTRGTRGFEAKPYPPGVAKLKAHHDVDIPVKSSPLPLKCRLAFISIFAQGKRQDIHYGKKAKVTSGAWLAANKLGSYHPVEHL